MEPTACINFLLTTTQSAVQLAFKSKLAPFDVTPAQYMVLHYLSEADSLSPSKLASLCCLDNSSITGLLTRMEKKGLIERRHSESDRRAVVIEITAHGAALMPEIRLAVEASDAQVLAVLSPEERQALKAYLSRIAAALA